MAQYAYRPKSPPPKTGQSPVKIVGLRYLPVTILFSLLMFARFVKVYRKHEAHQKEWTWLHANTVCLNSITITQTNPTDMQKSTQLITRVNKKPFNTKTWTSVTQQESTQLITRVNKKPLNIKIRTSVTTRNVDQHIKLCHKAGLMLQHSTAV